MIGPGAARIPLKYGHKATKVEARKHLMKAIDSGLTPIVGKAHIDNFIFGVPDNGDMLTVCFCRILYLFEKLPNERRGELIKPHDGL
jgi:UDP-glucose 4-epimerase